jgi:hypothetical protein
VVAVKNLNAAVSPNIDRMDSNMSFKYESYCRGEHIEYMLERMSKDDRISKYIESIIERIEEVKEDNSIVRIDLKYWEEDGGTFVIKSYYNYDHFEEYCAIEGKLIDLNKDLTTLAKNDNINIFLICRYN